MERLLGQLQGQLEGIQRSQDRLEQSMVDHMRTEEEVFRELRGQVEALRDAQAEIKADSKSSWKLLTFITAAAATGGAGVKHALEKFLG